MTQSLRSFQILFIKNHFFFCKNKHLGSVTQIRKNDDNLYKTLKKILVFYESKLKVTSSSVFLKNSQNLWSSSSIILQITAPDCPRMGTLTTNGCCSYQQVYPSPGSATWIHQVLTESTGEHRPSIHPLRVQRNLLCKVATVHE